MYSTKQDKKVKKANIGDLIGINKLLKSEHLPVVDPNEFSDYFYKALNQEGKIIGAIGLEIYGDYGLLRSMVVDTNFRNQGIANQLVLQIIETSADLGLLEVYLLTNTADQYFLRKGFVTVKRENCPPEIRESREYQGICPVSAILMSKKV